MERKPTALVIDDDRAYSQAMCDVLETAGVKMYVAVDAADAETLLQFLVPDLLIVDVKMPGMNGLDLVRRLRATAGWEQVPIIMASGLWLREDRDAALAAGANAHLAKPFNSEELLAMAGKFLPLVQTGSFSRLLRHEDLTR